VNHFLAERVLKIQNIVTDFEDGLMLINLLELISSKKLGKYNPKPRMKLHKTENLNVCLKFLKEEGIVLINIGSEDIYEHNERAILGLIWTLILRYEINLGGDSDSPKNQLLKWVNEQIKPYRDQVPPVKNFSKDWQKGDVLSALADSLRPGLVDMKALGEPLRDTDNAMAKSESAFDIPRLIDAPDLVAGADDHSVMTYVAQFRRWQEEEGKRRALTAANPKHSYAEGPGVTKGFAGRKLPFTVVSVDGFGKRLRKGGDDFKVEVTGPKGPVACDLKDNGDGTYSGAYQADDVGKYRVNVTLNKMPIKDSPYTCTVKPGADPARSYADGPGLHEAAEGRPAVFTVHAFDVDGHPVLGEDIRSAVTSADGKSEGPMADVGVSDNNDGTYTVTYVPTAAGPADVHATIVETPIRDMPKRIGVAKATSATNTSADGPGISGGFRDRLCPFTIHAMDADGTPVTQGGDAFEVQIVGPDGGPAPAMIRDNKDGTYSGAYKPTKVGDHKIRIQFKGQDIKGSPYVASIAEPADPTKSYAEGPGLKGAFNDKRAPFTIFALDKNGKPVRGEDVQVDIVKSRPRGPSRAAPGIPSAASSPSPAAPAAPPTPSSGADARLPKFCPGCGLATGGKKFCMNCGNPLLPVTTPRGGAGPSTPTSAPAPAAAYASPAPTLSAAPSGDNPAAERVEDIDIRDNGDGTYSVSYLAEQPGVYDIICKVNGQPIRDMPVTVTVHEGLDPAQTYAKGPGVEKGFQNRLLPFTIHAINGKGKPVPAGGDDFKVTLTDPDGVSRPVDVKDNGDGTYSGAYKPDKVGEYKVDIQAKGKPIKGSTYSVKVKKGADPAKSYAKGKGWRFAYDNLPSTFKIYAKDVDGQPVADEVVVVRISDATTVEVRAKHAEDGKLDMSEADRKKRIRENAGLLADDHHDHKHDHKHSDLPIGSDIPAIVKDNGDGTYSVEYTAPIPGDYSISVTVGEDPAHIKESPKPIKVYWSCPSKPCRPVQVGLHDEIHRLRKALAELEARTGAQAEAGATPVPVQAAGKPDDAKLQKKVQELEKSLALRDRDIASLEERLAAQGAAGSDPSGDRVVELESQLAEAKTHAAAKDAQIAKLSGDLERQGSADDGSVEEQVAKVSAEKDRQISQLEQQLREEQSAREQETKTLQTQMAEMLQAAEQMQADHDAKERELLARLEQAGVSGDAPAAAVAPQEAGAAEEADIYGDAGGAEVDAQAE
jgi:filamin